MCHLGITQSWGASEPPRPTIENNMKTSKAAKPTPIYSIEDLTIEDEHTPRARHQKDDNSW